MNLDAEISHLLDIMPASGRMFTKIVSKPQQAEVINTPFPLPWNLESRPIYINFDLWRKLSRGQRDLLLLRAVSKLTLIKWFSPNIYQGITLAGVIGLGIEVIQHDALGIVVAGSLTAIAASQVWKANRSIEKETSADEAAIRVAIRRGYTEIEAAEQLLSAIEATATIEERGLNFIELIRSQNLKVIANISGVGIPEKLKKSY